MTNLETVLKRVARRMPTSVIPTTTMEIHPSEWLTLTDEIKKLTADLELLKRAGCTVRDRKRGIREVVIES